MNRGAAWGAIADLIGELVNVSAPSTPAKAANPANRGHWRGFPAASAVASGCEKLRSEPTGDHGFAEIRSPSQSPNRPQSVYPCGFSQDSQGMDLQAREALEERAGILEFDAGLARAEAEAPPAGRHRAILHRLRRWGWPPELAAATAERIARRSLDDTRATCVECQHMGASRCRNQRRAGLMTPEVGRALAALPARCPGFAPHVD